MKYSFFSQLWKSKRFFTALQLSIMIIAIVPLVLVQQFTRNMIEEISKRIIETSGGHIQMVFTNKTQSLFNANEAKKIIKTESDIKNVFLEIQGGGILRKGSRRAGVQIRGVEQNMLLEKNFVQYTKVIDGSLKLNTDKNIILGNSIAQDIDAHVGDTVLLLTIQTQRPNLPPKITRFTVSGILTTSYKELDRSWAFISTSAAQKVIAQQDQRWFINMKIQNAFMLPNTINKLPAHLTNKGKQIINNTAMLLQDFGPVFSWFENNKSQFNLFMNTRILLNLVLFIAILLATITLASTMGLRVIDLETEIALLKSLGADPKALERCLFKQGFIYGSVSAVLGSMIGIGLSASANTLIAGIDSIINFIRSLLGQTSNISLLNNDFYIQDISFHLYFYDVLYVIVFAIVLSIGAAYFPVRRLRNIPAIRILRQHK